MTKLPLKPHAKVSHGKINLFPEFKTLENSFIGTWKKLCFISFLNANESSFSEAN